VLIQYLRDEKRSFLKVLQPRANLRCVGGPTLIRFRSTEHHAKSFVSGASSLYILDHLIIIISI
jgi:hypothetical protein